MNIRLRFIGEEVLCIGHLNANLALGFTDEGSAPTAKEVLKWLKNADGQEYEGYKGGHFKMTRHTPIYVANWGISTGTAVIGCHVPNADGKYAHVTILTGVCHYLYKPS